MADPIATGQTNIGYALNVIRADQPGRAAGYLQRALASLQDAADQMAAMKAYALANPNGVWLHGGTENGNPNGASFTVAQAREWWNLWFAHPVDLSEVRPTLLPGSFVLTSDEIKTAQQLQAKGNTLPKAPEDYNPLDLPVIP